MGSKRQGSNGNAADFDRFENREGAGCLKQVFGGGNIMCKLSEP